MTSLPPDNGSGSFFLASPIATSHIKLSYDSYDSKTKTATLTFTLSGPFIPTPTVVKPTGYLPPVTLIQDPFDPLHFVASYTPAAEVPDADPASPPYVPADGETWSVTGKTFSFVLPDDHQPPHNPGQQEQIIDVRVTIWGPITLPTGEIGPFGEKDVKFGYLSAGFGTETGDLEGEPL